MGTSSSDVDKLPKRIRSKKAKERQQKQKEGHSEEQIEALKFVGLRATLSKNNCQLFNY